MAYVAAAVGFAAMTLYAYRSGTVLMAASWSERVARLSLVFLLLALSVAFLDVAASQHGLLWRQWLVFAGLLGVACGHGALLWRLGHGREQYDR